MAGLLTLVQTGHCSDEIHHLRGCRHSPTLLWDSLILARLGEAETSEQKSYTLFRLSSMLHLHHHTEMRPVWRERWWWWCVGGGGDTVLLNEAMLWSYFPQPLLTPEGLNYRGPRCRTEGAACSKMLFFHMEQWGGGGNKWGGRLHEAELAADSPLSCPERKEGH